MPRYQHSDFSRLAFQPATHHCCRRPKSALGERNLHNPDYLCKPELTPVLPRSLIDWYHTEDGQWWRRRKLDIPNLASVVEAGRWQILDAEPIARVSAALSHFANNGGRLLFGSDTPSDPTFANPPGLNGRLEMKRWIEAGVTAEQLFRAATIENVEFFGLEDIGTVEVGKIVDLLLLQENPLLGIAAYDTIQTVIVAGRVISRAELAAAR